MSLLPARTAKALLSFTTLATLIASATLATSGAAIPGPAPLDPALLDGGGAAFSVLTYNIHGLPWPLASARPEAFDAMAARLRTMRAAGVQPHVVVLQEAFTADAKAIGRRSGYRYIVAGPGRDLANTAQPDADERAFASADTWRRGEGIGKFVDSGLEILSDYPVLAVRRVAFPTFACAGYDCLANKGALLVRLAVPGMPTPIDVVTAHLNSRGASGAPIRRSIAAYRQQVDMLTAFVAHSRDPANPLIVAGDFNVSGPARLAYLTNRAETAWTGANDALRHCYTPARPCGAQLPEDADRALRHGRDWQFYAPGHAAALAPIALTVPFGHEPGGGMLSDHIGYATAYRIIPARSTFNNPSSNAG